ncbi:MAG TPA: HEAT repeat domain-containing protein, partial [Bryobacteraceae bacterium]|nr:HEAT repeat domain-containing protein [Bryobacteraceae bacterium]
TPPWDWPAGTGDIFKNNLRNRRFDPSERLAAVELAGDLTVMDDEMADLLLSIVSNPDEPEELRGRAAIALGPVLDQTDTDGFDDDALEPPIEEGTFERIKEMLHKIHADERQPIDVRRRVLEASVRAEQDWHAEAIRAALRSGVEDWKLTAAFCMQYVSGFDQEIIELLSSPNPDIRYEAVVAAGEQEIQAAWPEIVALLDPENTEKRLLLAAIQAAASIRPREASTALADLVDSEDEDIADAVTDALLMAEQPFDEDEGEDEEAEDGEGKASIH